MLFISLANDCHTFQSCSPLIFFREKITFLEYHQQVDTSEQILLTITVDSKKILSVISITTKLVSYSNFFISTSRELPGNDNTGRYFRRDVLRLPSEVCFELLNSSRYNFQSFRIRKQLVDVEKCSKVFNAASLQI